MLRFVIPWLLLCAIHEIRCDEEDIEIIYEKPDISEAQIMDELATIMGANDTALIIEDDDDDDQNDDNVKPYCTAELLGREAYYVYTLGIFNYTNPTEYQRGLSAMFFTFYALGRSIAQGLDYCIAYNLAPALLKLGYERPREARDVIGEFYTLGFEEMAPVRGLVMDYFNNIEGNITTEDIDACNRAITKKVDSNPQYEDSGQYVLSVGRLAYLYKHQEGLVEAAETNTTAEFFAENKDALEPLLMQQAATENVLDSLTNVV